MRNMAEEKKDYSANQITVLEGLEAVRKRPAMYIGSTSKSGLHHLVWELVDNSVDEAMGGYCDTIEVTLNKDGSVTVKDNGRGIPVDIHPVYKRPAVEIAVTKLHAGGKFDKDSYAISGGLHGVGVSVVNALSKNMKVIVRRDGKIHQQEYERGKPSYDLKIIGSVDKNETGTEVTFFPDDIIFSTIKFEFSILQTRFREIAFLNKGLKIILKDDETGRKEIFHYEGGLIEFVKWVNKTKEALHKPIYFNKEDKGIVAEVAVQYNDGYQENVLGFVNTINTVEGGTHVVGFKTALTRAINDYSNKNKMSKEGNLTGDDVREGLTAIVSVKVPEPQFEGQTKTKLGNSEVKGIVDSISMIMLSQFFEENPAIARKIVGKALDAQKARNAAKKAKDLVRRKSAFGSSGLPGKLKDCARRKSEETELFIVEGDSAGGCFSGDTKIALADGRNLSFVELVEEQKEGKKNFCYTIRSDGSIGVEKILNPRKTKKSAKLIEVELDNGEKIKCTPNHRFMLRNGDYVKAQDIKKGDSLMPFYKKKSEKKGIIRLEGYDIVLNPKNSRWKFTHLLADKWNVENNIYPLYPREMHRHHADFNKLNNNPTNIFVLSPGEHFRIHNEHISKTLHTEEAKNKAKIAHQNPEYRKKASEISKKYSEMLSEKAKRQWKDENYKRYMTQRYLAFYNTNPEYRKAMQERLNLEQKKYWSNKNNRNEQSQKIKEYFKENPEAREQLSNTAIIQWKDENLREWRAKKTSEQWTDEFRRSRKKALSKTYYFKVMSLLKKLYDEKHIDDYEKARIRKNDKSYLSLPTFLQRYFSNDKQKLFETLENYNHKVANIRALNIKEDVYDIEVPNTHNFALASGVFVHNSAVQARNNQTQAILPLRGKPLNVEKASPVKVLGNEEIANLITAIGAGIGESFDISKIRYSKVILMADADVDGAHIKTLLLTFFYRFLPELIKQGHIYIAVSPLYRVRKRGDHYVYSDEELKEIKKKLGDNASVLRFKGLGEMNPEQLWDTTMNPKTRMLKKVTVEDAALADETFSKLMGDDVSARKTFIAERAKEAEIDV